MHSSRLSLLTLFVLIITAVSCGRHDDSVLVQDSQVSSLTGFPCQDYEYNRADYRYLCTSIAYGSQTVDVLWHLSGEFSPEMATKLKEAISLAVFRFNDHMTSSAYPTPLMNCIVRNSTNSWDAIGSLWSTSSTEPNQKAVWSLTALTMGFHHHWIKKLPLEIDAFDEAAQESGAIVVGRAFIGDDKVPVTAPMNFRVNRVALTREDISVDEVGGLVIHELLHRRGYTHPSVGRSVGPLIYEVGNCITDVNHGLFGLTSSINPLLEM